MTHPNYTPQHNPARRMHLAQRTRVRMMPHQKIILASSVLFVLTLGFVVFVNLAETGNTSAAIKNDDTVKVENKNTGNVDNYSVNDETNAGEKKSIRDTATGKFSDKK